MTKPNNATVQGKSVSNDHEFALFDTLKMGNFMTCAELMKSSHSVVVSSLSLLVLLVLTSGFGGSATLRSWADHDVTNSHKMFIVKYPYGRNEVDISDMSCSNQLNSFWVKGLTQLHPRPIPGMVLYGPPRW